MYVSMLGKVSKYFRCRSEICSECWIWPTALQNQNWLDSVNDNVAIRMAKEMGSRGQSIAELPYPLTPERSAVRSL